MISKMLPSTYLSPLSLLWISLTNYTPEMTRFAVLSLGK